MSYFERKTRDDGTVFLCRKDDAPEWVADACQEAHHGTFPDDWIYEEIAAAFDAWEEHDGQRPDDHEHADGRVDIYTKDRFRWAADMCLTDLFSEAQDQADMGGCGDLQERIGIVQYYAIQMIANTIWDAIEAAAGEEEAPAAEECDGDPALCPCDKAHV